MVRSGSSRQYTFGILVYSLRAPEGLGVGAESHTMHHHCTSALGFVHLFATGPWGAEPLRPLPATAIDRDW